VSFTDDLTVPTLSASTPSERWTPRRVVLLTVGAVLILRLTYLSVPLFPDEAGYSLVAQSWRAGGPNLYGHYFVDRPPLLMGLYRLAYLAGGEESIRLLASGFAVLLVLAAAWAAHETVGRRGIGWAVVVAGALVTTPLLGAQEADGEIFAAPLVMLSVAAILAAVRRRGGPAFGLAVLAGLSGSAAVLVKQNFLDTAVFAAVLLVVSLWQRELTPRAAARLVAGGLTGAAVMAVSALLFVAWSRTGLPTAWSAVFGFRRSALQVITDYSLRAPMIRARDLLRFGALAGLVPLLVLLALEVPRRRLRGSPVAWAVGATLVFECASIAVGGSYWAHYLIQLAPMLALAAGAWAPGTDLLRMACATVVVSALAATAVLPINKPTPHDRQVVGDWLHRIARPGDTATVLFGNADVQASTGMRSPYPHLWTLPMRTLDPRLAHLRAVLAGRRAPTWVVAWAGLNPWHMDPAGHTRRTLVARYRPVAELCGHRIYLRLGVSRHVELPSGSPRC